MIEDEIFDQRQKKVLQYALPRNGELFTRYFFKHREASRFMVNQHHPIIINTMSRVLTGEIKRLIINVPPGYTKTELAVIHFCAQGLALNPKARFIHVSYSDDLALLNSSIVRDIVETEQYQELWPMNIRQDTSSKKRWFTQHGGGMYAVSSGGAITGFRAGRMEEGFTGAFIVDDPIKPEDYDSDKTRDRINRRFTNTFRSRLAVESVPIILIMQRIGANDPTGFLLNGGTGEKWHHLLLPVKIPEKKEEYDYKRYPFGIPVDYDLPPGPLWSYKHTRKDIKMLQVSDPLTCDAQYMQDPRPDGGAMFEEDDFEIVETVPAGGLSVRGWDLAGTDNNTAAFTAGVKITYVNRVFYIEHVYRIRKDPLKVENGIKSIASVDGKGTIIDIPQDPGQAGKSQALNFVSMLAGYDIRTSPESGSKKARASGLAAQARAGNVKLVAGPWNKEFVHEAVKFPDGKFKDQIDGASRAFHRIIEELSKGNNKTKFGRVRGQY